ncbi:MAG TPA: YsnF/AvaK domain-containing protein [Allosphingosinicella sp.]|jgi:stress response protein YsnF|uniref:YsnF/AvaK domain-containing protein n=1 Tax=Allosphingosinicella sp. TaxID=2823234 RepID=UPI002F2823BE
MIRTVTALFDDTGEAEAAFDLLSRRLAILKGAIVTCGPGEKPDFGAIYLSRAQREACEEELTNGGSLVIVQIEGDQAAEQAVDLLDRHAQGDAANPAPAPIVAPPAPIAAAAPPAQVAAMAPPSPEANPRIAKGGAPNGSVEGVPISTLSRRIGPAPVEPEPQPIDEPIPQLEPAPVAVSEPEPAPPAEAEARIPLVEEELRVGKRTLVRGGARVHSYMEEVPVTTDVELLEERTSVERRPVNRRLTDEEIVSSGLLQDRVVEITQMREEAVVTKEAVVREELVVKKTIEKRVEQIHETVRRTAVEMERLEPELAGAEQGARPA